MTRTKGVFPQAYVQRQCEGQEGGKAKPVIMSRGGEILYA